METKETIGFEGDLYLQSDELPTQLKSTKFAQGIIAKLDMEGFNLNERLGVVEALRLQIESNLWGDCIGENEY